MVRFIFQEQDLQIRWLDQTWPPSRSVERTAHDPHGGDAVVEGASAAAVELKNPRGPHEVLWIQRLQSLGLAYLERREGGEVILQVLSHGQVNRRPDSVPLQLLLWSDPRQHEDLRSESN